MPKKVTGNHATIGHNKPPATIAPAFWTGFRDVAKNDQERAIAAVVQWNRLHPKEEERIKIVASWPNAKEKRDIPSLDKDGNATKTRPVLALAYKFDTESEYGKELDRTIAAVSRLGKNATVEDTQRLTDARNARKSCLRVLAQVKAIGTTIQRIEGYGHFVVSIDATGNGSARTYSPITVQEKNDKKVKPYLRFSVPNFLRLRPVKSTTTIEKLVDTGKGKRARGAGKAKNAAGNDNAGPAKVTSLASGEHSLASVLQGAGLYLSDDAVMTQLVTHGPGPESFAEMATVFCQLGTILTAKMEGDGKAAFTVLRHILGPQVQDAKAKATADKAKAIAKVHNAKARTVVKAKATETPKPATPDVKAEPTAA